MISERKERTRSKRKWLWLLVPVAIYAIFMMRQNWPKSRHVPDELVGTWRTSNPNYAGRFFEIGSVSLSFGTGEGAVTTGLIQQVEAAREGSSTLYTITFVESGKEELCSFYYTPAKEKTIIFKNQLSINWTKDKDRKNQLPVSAIPSTHLRGCRAAVLYNRFAGATFAS